MATPEEDKGVTDSGVLTRAGFTEGNRHAQINSPGQGVVLSIEDKFLP